MMGIFSKLFGDPENDAVKFQQVKELADLGVAAAQNNIGVMYDKGKGVARDYAQAVMWFRKAADQGYAGAQNNLGNKYCNGEGVSEDYTQAMMWYLIANAGGATETARILPALKKYCTQAQFAEAERMASEWWAVYHPTN